MATSLGTSCVAEFLGTYLLVFTIGCNVLSKTPVWAGVSIACILMVAIYSLGGISGANFNPAVSVSLATCNSMKGPGGMTWNKCGAYCLSQILGGVTASICYSMLFWNAFYLGPHPAHGVWSAGICELLYTFMLCFVVLNVAVARKYEIEGNQFYGLAIGFVIVAGAYGAGVISGGCFNPAVAIAIDTSSAGLHAVWWFVYTIFELIGAVLAAVAFKMVRPGDFGGRMFEEDPIHSTSSKLVCEFLGTYMLVLTVGLNVLGNSPAGAFSIAAALMCMIYALGDISGANFNPAVSLAIMLSKMDPKSNWKDTGLYMVVQTLGGIMAGFTYWSIYKGRAFPLGPLSGYSWLAVAHAEFTFTFLLCYVVLCTAVAQTKSAQMFGLAIGSCVTVGGFAIGSISGGSLNPAVSVGISAVGGQFYKAVIYSLIEFVGGATAAVVAKNITHK